jgi:hypothetical protein
MREWIYRAIYWIAEMHDHILSINDQGGWYFNDKQLHFIVIGALGMLGIFIFYPLFKLLAKYNHEMVIAWIYVFTVMIVITFAIEIGQHITHTGKMEFADIMFGLVGFMVMFCIFLVVRMIYHGIIALIKYIRKRIEMKAAAPTQPTEEPEEKY